MTKIYNEFNYYFETLGLLFYSNNFDNTKNNLISKLDQLGIAGEKMYNSHFLIWERTILDFDENKKVDENYEFYFRNESNEAKFYLFLSVLVGEYSEQLMMKQYSKKELKNIVLELIQNITDEESSNLPLSTKDFYEYLLRLDLSESEKWKFFSFYQTPDKYINQLMDLINQNLALTNSIYQSNDIEKLVSKLSVINDKANQNVPILKLGADLPIRPTFINPLLQMISKTQCYFGILNFEVIGNNDFSSEIDDNILMKIKALSDKSKLQILINLKRKPMYSLELANEMELSAGTISHHMSSLLQVGLVTVEKKSGKVYYQINVDGISELLARLDTLFI